MRILLSIIFLVIYHFVAKAEYTYLSLSSLVCNADYGAVGTIVQLDKNYFYLKVDSMVLGDLDLDTLKVQRFEDWNCGHRYEKYAVGQKELVLFGKSNYVIEDYELLGYGSGGEFELPIDKDSIYYHFRYNKLHAYSVRDFLAALQDFDVIKQETKETSIPISTEEQKRFANKSVLHKLFIECKSGKREKDFKIPVEGYIVNLESNYLYKDYENKIYIANLNMDSVMLSVEDADVWKEGKYFVVKPKAGWTRRWLNVYAKNDRLREKVLFNQIFQILELPEPVIYFDGYYRDSVYYTSNGIPTAAHYLDEMHKDEHLDYELLSYTYEIKSKGHIESFKIKSARGTNELRGRIRKLQPDDEVTIKDVYVQYPNKSVKKIKGRTVYMARSE